MLNTKVFLVINDYLHILLQLAEGHVEESFESSETLMNLEIALQQISLNLYEYQLQLILPSLLPLVPFELENTMEAM